MLKLGKGTRGARRGRRQRPSAMAVRRRLAVALVLVPVLALVWLAGAALRRPALAQADAGYRAFLAELWPEAQRLGISRATFDRAFEGVEPDRALPDLVLPGQEVKGQPEFTRTPAQYLDADYLGRLSEQGRALLKQHAAHLEKIEKELGVQRQFVLAIWGRETAFGSHRSNYYVIKALATQAYLGRRKDMFRTELLYALKMLEDGVRTRETMTGSWAGAMGLTQFMPSEYYTVAYDLDGDGRKDIWTSTGDALASAANQLRAKGWVPGQSWGYEVRLPVELGCVLEGPDQRRPLKEWVKMGVTRVAGAFPADVLEAPAFLLMPAGSHGPAFLALENFLVIKAYNMSDLYALFVGNLGDRIGGGQAFTTPWADVKQLSATAIQEIQTGLKKLGYDVAKIDGKAGMNTRALIGIYQKASNLKVDCWPTEAIVKHLRANPHVRASATGTPAETGATAPR
jgi:lytic murein transglycosylase